VAGFVGRLADAFAPRTAPTRQGESLTTQSHAWVAGLVRQGALSVPTRADSAPDFRLCRADLNHFLIRARSRSGNVLTLDDVTRDKHEFV